MTRVVLTSSSSAIVNPLDHKRVYDESHWAPFTAADIKAPDSKLTGYAYAAGKKLAEEAAWAFVEREKPKFELAVCNPTYVFGPIAPPWPVTGSLEALNASSHLVRDMLLGRLRGAALPPTRPVFTFVDVRDVAVAHVRAMTVPAAGGLRFYTVSEHWSVKRVRDILWDEFEELRERLPEGGEDDLDEETVYRFDNRRSREVLGVEYRGLRESIVGSARSMLAFLEEEKARAAK